MTSIKILNTIAGAFKSANGAQAQFAEAASWFDAFASDLERMNEYITEYPTAKCTGNIIEQVDRIQYHYEGFER